MSDHLQEALRRYEAGDYARQRADDSTDLLVALHETEQANVQATLASGSDAAALTAKVQALTAASTAVKTYFASISSRIRTVLRNNAGDVFGSINSSVVTRDVETRGYVVTFVTDWGEESAPSPVSATILRPDGVTVAVTTSPSLSQPLTAPVARTKWGFWAQALLARARVAARQAAAILRGCM